MTTSILLNRGIPQSVINHIIYPFLGKTTRRPKQNYISRKCSICERKVVKREHNLQVSVYGSENSFGYKYGRLFCNKCYFAYSMFESDEYLEEFLESPWMEDMIVIKNLEKCYKKGNTHERHYIRDQFGKHPYIMKFMYKKTSVINHRLDCEIFRRIC